MLQAPLALWIKLFIQWLQCQSGAAFFTAEKFTNHTGNALTVAYMKTNAHAYLDICHIVISQLLEQYSSSCTKYVLIWLLIWKAGLFQTTLGKVSIQIIKIVTEAVYSGLSSLNHDDNKDRYSRTLEIEIIQSNRLSNDDI